MQTARQIAYRYGPRAVYKLGRYAYRKLRTYKKKSAKKRSVRLFYESQNITANINFNYGFNLVPATTGVDPGTVTGAFQYFAVLDIMTNFVNCAAHQAYSKLYDQYKIASCAAFYIPYSLTDRDNAYKNHEITQANLFGVVDNTYQDDGVNDIQWNFLQTLQNPKTKFTLWSTGSGLQSILSLYANPETAEQKDDWTSTLDFNGGRPIPQHFHPIAYIGAQVMPKEPIQDASAWPSGNTGAYVAGGFRLAFKVYYRNPRLSDQGAHKQEIQEIMVNVQNKN